MYKLIIIHGTFNVYTFFLRLNSMLRPMKINQNAIIHCSIKVQKTVHRLFYSSDY